MLGYLAYVALATGQLDGWSRIQRAGWSSYLDGGASTAEFSGDALAGGSEVYDLAIVLALAASLVLLVLAIRMRLPWPLVVYGALVLVLVWGSNGPAHSKLRLLVPAFTLLRARGDRAGAAAHRHGRSRGGRRRARVRLVRRLRAHDLALRHLTLCSCGLGLLGGLVAGDRARVRVRASGSLRVFTRLATVTTTSTTRITPSETGVEISGIAGLMSVCAQCRISFDADEREDQRQAGREVDQPVEQPRHQEEQRAQAEQGERVGGEHDERLAR